MTPDQIIARLRELDEKFGNLPYGETLIVGGKPVDVWHPEFLTNGDTLYVFPYGTVGECAGGFPLDVEIIGPA